MMKPLLLCSATMALVFYAGLAQAQTDTQTGAAAPAPIQEMIVTGSRIRRDPLVQASPVVVIDQAAIQQTGLSAVADVLQRLPSASGGLNSKVNNSGNIGNPPDGGGVGAGSAEIDLRYLGAKRTLVLVDGIRFVNGASASGIPSTVDLNTIPVSSIDRIEVLQSGQSPLYGSDALAGVINIITKSAQQGLQLSAQYGSFLHGDGQTQDYNGSYGLKLSRTSIVFGGSYVNQGAVKTADRSTSQFPNPFQTSCSDPIGGCSSATPNGRFVGIPGAAGSLTLKHGPIVGRPNYNPLDPTGATSDFKAFTSADRFDFAPLNYFLTPSERYGAWLSVKQELSSNVNLRVKAEYSRRNSQNQAAFLPLFIGPDAGNGNLLDTITIDATNPYNPFGQLSAGGAGQPPANYSFIARRLVENGQRTYTQHVDTRNVTATLDGSFMFNAHKFFWDANATAGFNDANQTFTGNLNAAKLAQALGPVALCTAPCVPFDLFGGAGSITPAMLDFVAFTEHDQSRQELYDFTVNLSGDLVDLPAGPLGVAVGYEHRYQFGRFDPDPVIVAGLGADIPAQPAVGHYSTNEIYGEVRVPIVKNVPFIDSLEADGSVRYADYSTGFSSTTYTGTGLWKPVPDLLLRGSYATGFRAPAIGELYGAASRADAPIDDPCTNVPGSPYQSSATVRANCTANGVPANGSYAEPTGGQLAVLTGGNPRLKPETSQTLLFGAVYAPSWARNSGYASQLSLEVNYYDIKVSNAIAPTDAQLTLSRCANSADALSCAAITRTPNGLIQRINATLQNIGEISTQGVDITFNYRTPKTDLGYFGLSLNGNYLLTYKETFPAAVGFTTTDYTGVTRGFPDQSYPRFKGTGVIDWAFGDVDAAFTGRYIDHVIETSGQAGNRLGDTFYGDLRLSVSPASLQHRVAFTVGVNNVFDQNPPACYSCTGPNYDPTTYDVPGQFAYFRVTVRQ